MSIHLSLTNFNSAPDIRRETALVSIIIPCYKQANYLPAAIESVVNQTYRNFEIIVVDDGSPDDTASVVEKFPAVKYLRQDNRGSASARNTGWKACTGVYVVFLDADDLLSPDALAVGVRSLDEHQSAAIAFGRCRYLFADTELGHVQPPQPTKDFYTEMLKGCLIWHPAAMMCRSKVFESGIAFDESIRIGSDYDFYLKIARQFEMHCHNHVISDYMQHGSNKSYNLTGAMNFALAVLDKQRPYLAEKQEYKKAYEAGIDNAYNQIGYRLLDELSVRKDSKLERDRVRAAFKAIISDPRALPRVLRVLKQGGRDGRIAYDRTLFFAC